MAVVVGTDSYVTNAEAIAYLADAINGQGWASLDVAAQDRALITATRMIDRARWQGSRTVDGQTLAWPRTDVTCFGVAVDSATVPDRIKTGQIELANLLSIRPAVETNPTGAQTTGLRRVQAGTVQLEFWARSDNVDIASLRRFPTIVHELIGCFLQSSVDVAGNQAFGVNDDSSFDRTDLDQFGLFRGVP